MTLDNLIEKLSAYGEVQICKEDTVFTLLMTGDNLDNAIQLTKIQMMVSEYATSYPMIEVMRNDKNYLCVVLSPEKKKVLKATATPIREVDDPMISLADVRNKLTPVKNIIELFNLGHVKAEVGTNTLLSKEIKKAKEALEYFSSIDFATEKNEL